MLTIRDFYTIPQVEPLFSQLVNDTPGLVVVAGLDPRPGETYLPSGRMAMVRYIFSPQPVIVGRLPG